LVTVNQRSPSDVEISIPPNVQLIKSVSSTGSLEHLRQWHLVYTFYIVYKFKLRLFLKCSIIDFHNVHVAFFSWIAWQRFKNLHERKLSKTKSVL
jgi:hypothetical protein